MSEKERSLKQMLLGVGLAMFAVAGHAAEDAKLDPGGECAVLLSEKGAEQPGTAEAMSEFIADLCMEKVPFRDCGTMPAAMCDDLDRQTRATQRELLRQMSYKLIVLKRQAKK